MGEGAGTATEPSSSCSRATLLPHPLPSGTAAEIEHFSFECPPEDKLIVPMAVIPSPPYCRPLTRPPFPLLLQAWLLPPLLPHPLPSGTAAEIEHFSFECPPEDKLIVTMALLKLGLVRKKTLIFVNTVDRVSRREAGG